MTWSIKRYPRAKPNENLATAISNAFKFWQKHINLKLKFSRTDADIEIYFMPPKHGDRQDFLPHETGHAFHPGQGGNIHFNEEVWWSEDDEG